MRKLGCVMGVLGFGSVLALFAGCEHGAVDAASAREMREQRSARARADRGALRQRSRQALTQASGNARPQEPLDAAPDATLAAAYRPFIFQVNPAVAQYIHYFSENAAGRKTFQEWLNRAGSYVNMIHAELDAQALPRDLMAVSFVESGVLPNAVSPAGATGMWQFISSTGRIYGLAQTDDIDQRRAPQLATQAAARYLRELHDQFADWPLALAAYNAGGGRVTQLMDSARSRDFWSLTARCPDMPEETANYVPKVLAVVTLLRDLKAYGFEPIVPRPLPPARRISVTPATPLALAARALALPLPELRRINPEIVSSYVPLLDGSGALNIPENRAHLAELVLTEGGNIVDREVLQRLAHVPVPEFNLARARCFPLRCDQYEDREGWERMQEVLNSSEHQLYRIKAGDSLAKVAALFGIDTEQLKRENGVREPRAIQVGQLLRVPAPATTM